MSDHPNFGVNYRPIHRVEAPEIQGPQAQIVAAPPQAVEGDVNAPPEPEEDEDVGGGDEVVEDQEDTQDN